MASAPHDGGPLFLKLSESGLPLSGRNATAAETARLGNQRQVVLRVDPAVLGNNGRRYFAQSGSTWQFTADGRAWADVLFY